LTANSLLNMAFAGFGVHYEQAFPTKSLFGSFQSKKGFFQTQYLAATNFAVWNIVEHELR
jgi:hypothetical protein